MSASLTPTLLDSIEANLPAYCDYLALTAQKWPRQLYPNLLTLAQNPDIPHRLDALKRLSQGDTSQLPDSSKSSGRKDEAGMPADSPMGRPARASFLKGFAERTGVIDVVAGLFGVQKVSMTSAVGAYLKQTSAQVEDQLRPVIQRLRETRAPGNMPNEPMYRRHWVSFADGLKKCADNFEPSLQGRDLIQWAQPLLYGVSEIAADPDLWLRHADALIAKMDRMRLNFDDRAKILAQLFNLMHFEKRGLNLGSILVGVILAAEQRLFTMKEIGKRFGDPLPAHLNPVVRRETRELIPQTSKLEGELFRATFVGARSIDSAPAGFAEMLSRLLSLRPPHAESEAARLVDQVLQENHVDPHDPLKSLEVSADATLTAVLRGVLSGYSSLLAGEPELARSQVVIRTRIFMPGMMDAKLDRLRGHYVELRRALILNRDKDRIPLAALQASRRPSEIATTANALLRAIRTLRAIAEQLEPHLFNHRHALLQPNAQGSVDTSYLTTKPRERLIPYHDHRMDTRDDASQSHTVLNAISDLAYLGMTLAYWVKDRATVEMVSQLPGLIEKAEAAVNERFQESMMDAA